MRLLFENYVLDVPRRELRRDDLLVPVEPQVFDLLVYLVRNRDRVVTKDELFAAVWQGRVVSEMALTTRLNAARTAIMDSGKQQRLIRTLRHSGFRFAGEVRELHPRRVADLVVSPDHGDAAQVVSPLSAPDRPSLAVLPFRNFRAPELPEYFVDGIVEEITTALAKWKWFLVIDRNSAFAYKNAGDDSRTIGEAFGVRYLLGGSARVVGRRLRISAQLLEAATGVHIWADHFDAEMADVFAVQEELANAVVASLEPQLHAAELRRIRRKRPEDLTVYDRHLEALWHSHVLTEKNTLEALRLLSGCLELDPGYAPAAALASFCYRTRRQQGWSSSTRDDALGMAFAERALACDPDDPFVLWSAGHAITALGKEHMRARGLIDKSLALNPNCAQAWAVSGWNHDHIGDRAAALDDFQFALRLSPFDPMNYYVLAGISCAYMNTQQYEKALEFGWRSIRARSTFATAWRSVAVSLAYLGRRKEARAAVDQLRGVDPGLTVTMVDQSRCNIADPHERRHYLDGLRLAGLPMS
jgi:adenylate cyclase